MALDINMLTKDIVIIDEYFSKTLVVEMPSGPPRFLSRKDLVELLQGDPTDAPKRRSAGSRSLAKLGFVAAEVRRGFSKEKVVNAHYCRSLADKIQAFDGEIPVRFTSQVGHMFDEFLNEWRFEDRECKRVMAEFMDKNAVLRNIPKNLK